MAYLKLKSISFSKDKSIFRNKQALSHFLYIGGVR